MKIGLSKRRRRGKEILLNCINGHLDAHRWPQRALIIHSSSFRFFCFAFVRPFLWRNNYDPLPRCSFSKFHPFHLLLLSTKLYLTFHRCPNFPSSRLKILSINLTFFFSTFQLFEERNFFPLLASFLSLSLSLSNPPILFIVSKIFFSTPMTHCFCNIMDGINSHVAHHAENGIISGRCTPPMRGME